MVQRKEDPEHLEKRRRVVKRILSGSGAAAGIGALPQAWRKPVVEAVVTPAHAQTSTENGGEMTTTAATTTTTTSFVTTL